MSHLSKRDKYRIFCQEESAMPIFMKDWWLDAVCIFGQWDVGIVEKDGKVIAAWPYYFTRKFGLTLINVPPMGKFSGPWIKYPEGQKEHSKLAFEKEVIEDLISQLPHFSRFRQYFHYGITNWLPLYWKDFSQTTYYSYRIPKQQNLDSIYAGFKSSVKNKIQKAKQQVEVRHTSDFDSFNELLKKTSNSRKISHIYSDQVLIALDSACKRKQASTILTAFDKRGVSIAAIYLVWDNENVYYVLSGMDQHYKGLEANSLLIWEAIKFAMQKNLAFDFEGSMIKGIEHFFRSFGAEQTPYFYISKTNFLPFRLLDAFKNKN